MEPSFVARINQNNEHLIELGGYKGMILQTENAENKFHNRTD